MSSINCYDYLSVWLEQHQTTECTKSMTIIYVGWILGTTLFCVYFNPPRFYAADYNCKLQAECYFIPTNKPIVYRPNETEI